MSDDTTLTRRSVLGATGTAAAAAVGAVGSAAAIPGCVQTVTDTGGASTCGGYAETTIQAGRSGLVQETCTSGGNEYKLVEFDCTETWWVDSTYLGSASDCFC